MGSTELGIEGRHFLDVVVVIGAWGGDCKRRKVLTIAIAGEGRWT